jgi:hypothetical protein
LLKMLLLAYLYGLSERQVEELSNDSLSELRRGPRITPR